MDGARALLAWPFLRVVLLVLALWLAIEMLALQGPDPEVPATCSTCRRSTI